MKIYETLDAVRFPLDRLTPEERATFDALYRYARRRPDWNRFSNRSWRLVQGCYAARKLSRRQIVAQPLHQIAQDLESRLAIAQGKAAPPDYRVELELLLKRANVTRYKLAQMTSVSQDLLSHVFRGRKNLSIPSLTKVLDALGYRITFAPKVGKAGVEDAIRQTA